MEHDLKALAFPAWKNIGIILLGIGAGMIFHTYGLPELAALGLLAGLYHTINHATFKALLFFGAGAAVLHAHQKHREYGGCFDACPGRCLFLIGACVHRCAAAHERIRQ